MIFVVCANCQSKLKVQDTAAGKRITCPKCKSAVQVPAAGTTSNSAPANDVVTSPSGDQWNDFGTTANQGGDAFGGQADLFSMSMSDLAAPTAGTNNAPMAYGPAANYGQGYYQGTPTNANSPKPASKQTKEDGKGLSVALIAAIAGGGVLTFIMLVGVGIWFLLGSSKKQTQTQPEMVAQSSTPDNSAVSQAPQPTPPSASQPSPPIPTLPPTSEPTFPEDNTYVTLLDGDETLRPIPSDPPLWVEQYNKARELQLVPFAFRRTERDGLVWVAGRINPDIPGAWAYRTITQPTENLPLLKYRPDPKMGLQVAPTTSLKTPLLVKEYAGPDFQIQRLKPFGLMLSTNSGNDYSKVRSLAWSADGNTLYMLQGNPRSIRNEDGNQILKINTSTWEIEASVNYPALDIAMCSEGLAISTYNKDQMGNRLGEDMEFSSGDVRFPLQSNKDTKYHLAVLDPATLNLKFSFPMPFLSSLAATPNSSRVFASHNGDFLIEVDVRSGELINIAHSKEKFQQIEVDPSQNAVFGFSMDRQLYRHNIAALDDDKPLLFSNNVPWWNFSPDGKLVLVGDMPNYSLLDAENPETKKGVFLGPMFGMAAIDSETKAIIAAGIDSSGQLTAQIHQDSGSWDISLGPSKHFNSGGPKLARKSNPPELTQAGEPLAHGLAPLLFQLRRTPYYLSTIPNGKGFLMFTFDGAFVIKPLKKGANYFINSEKMQKLDIGPQLVDDSAERIRLAPPQSVKENLNLARIQSDRKGTIFEFPSKAAILGATCDPSTGDVYFLTRKDIADTKPIPELLVVRCQSIGATQGDSISCKTAQFSSLPTKNAKISFVQYGGKSCIAISGSSLVWFLDPATLEPLKFNDVANPLDLTKDPYLSALKLTPEVPIICELVNSEPNQLRLLAWQENFVWLNGIDIDSTTGKVLGSVPPDGYTTPGNSGESRRIAVRDPLKQLTVSNTNVTLNSRVLKAPVTPQFVLSGHPWLVGLNQANLVFMNRSKLDELISIPAPGTIIGNPIYPNQYIENPKTDSLILTGTQAKSGPLVWFLPIADVNLPKRSVIVSDIKLPKSIAPGEALKVSVSNSNRELKVKLLSGPEGLTYENDTISWAPTDSNLGSHKIDFELTLGEESVVESHSIAVSQSMLLLDVRPLNLSISQDGRYLAGWSQNRICIIDTQENKVISATDVDFLMMRAAVMSDKVIFYIDNNEFREIPFAAPSKIKANKANVTNLGSSTLSNLYLSRGENNLIFLDFRRFGAGNPVQTMFVYPSMAKSPLQSYLTDQVRSYGHIPFSNDTLMGGVILDDKDKVSSIVNLGWTGMFQGNPTDIFVGYQLDQLHTDPWIISNNNQIAITPRLNAVLTATPIPNSSDFTVEWRVTLDGNETKNFGGFVLSGDVLTQSPIGSTKCLKFADRIHFAIGPYYSSVKIPDEIFASESAKAGPLRVKPQDPLTFLSTSKKDLEFEISGGTPPYSIQVNPTWGVYKETMDDADNNAKKPIVEATVKDTKATVTINGREFLPALFKKPTFWLGFVTNHIFQENQPKDAAARLTAHRNNINKKLEDVTKTKCRGVPMGLNLVLTVTDSNAQTVSLTHCLIIDFPTEQFLKLLNNR